MPRVVKTLLLASSLFLLTPLVSLADNSWLQQLGNSLGNNSSDNSSNDSGDDQATSVAGVRGLEETGKNVDTKARDYAAVDRLEKVQISDAALNAFIKEGGLK